MRDRHLARADKLFRPIAPMPLGRSRGVPLRRILLMDLRLLRFPPHGAGLFPPTHWRQHVRTSMPSLLDLLAIGVAPRDLPRSVQNSVQFLPIYIDPLTRLHATVPSSSRNRFVSG